MKGATSIDMRPCKVYNAQRHCSEEQRKKYDYINHELTSRNVAWHAYDGRTLKQAFDDACAEYTSAVGQKPQLKAVTRFSHSSGKKRTIDCFAPIREAVVVIKPDTTEAQVDDLCRKLERVYGFTALAFSIHRDEGHWVDEVAEDGETSRAWKPNYHAHIFLDVMERRPEAEEKKKGRTIKLTKKQLSLMQDLAAESLGMQRGEPRASRERYNAMEYKVKAKTEELAETQRAKIAAESRRMRASAAAGVAEQRAADATDRAEDAENLAKRQEARLADAKAETEQVKTTAASARIAVNKAKTAMGESAAKWFGVNKVVNKLKAERDEAKEEADKWRDEAACLDWERGEVAKALGLSSNCADLPQEARKVIERYDSKIEEKDAIICDLRAQNEESRNAKEERDEARKKATAWKSEAMKWENEWAEVAEVLGLPANSPDLPQKTRNQYDFTQSQLNKQKAIIRDLRAQNVGMVSREVVDQEKRGEKQKGCAEGRTTLLQSLLRFFEDVKRLGIRFYHSIADVIKAITDGKKVPFVSILDDEQRLWFDKKDGAELPCCGIEPKFGGIEFWDGQVCTEAGFFHGLARGITQTSFTIEGEKTSRGMSR